MLGRCRRRPRPERLPNYHTYYYYCYNIIIIIIPLLLYIYIYIYILSSSLLLLSYIVYASFQNLNLQKTIEHHRNIRRDSFAFDRFLLGKSLLGWQGRATPHSAKGGAVETGCSDLYDVIY